MYLIVLDDKGASSLLYDNLHEAILRARSMAVRAVECDGANLSSPFSLAFQVRNEENLAVWTPLTDPAVQGARACSAPQQSTLVSKRRQRAHTERLMTRDFTEFPPPPPCPWDGQEIAEALGMSVYEGWLIYAEMEGQVWLHHKAKVFRDALRKQGFVFGHLKRIARAWREGTRLRDSMCAWHTAHEKEKTCNTKKS